VPSPGVLPPRPGPQITKQVPVEETETKGDWYFTFGVNWGPLGKRFVKISDTTYEDARAQIVIMFGTRWAFQYDQQSWTDTRSVTYGMSELRELVLD
jgi:hypothetical protein